MHARIPVFVYMGKGGCMLFILPRVNFNSPARNSNFVQIQQNTGPF